MTGGRAGPEASILNPDPGLVPCVPASPLVGLWRSSPHIPTSSPFHVLWGHKAFLIPLQTVVPPALRPVGPEALVLLGNSAPGHAGRRQGWLVGAEEEGGVGSCLFRPPF